MSIKWEKIKGLKNKYRIAKVEKCKTEEVIIDNEVWSTVKGYENRYMVSSIGRFLALGRSIITKHGHYRKLPDRFFNLTPKKSSGYVEVQLRDNSGSKYAYVHRLVAQSFLDNPENLPVINHIDTIRDNNKISNLEWVTVSDNLTYNDSHRRGGEKRKKRVFQYTLDNYFIKPFNSVQECEDAGYSKSGVGKVCRGTQEKHGGYRWSYD